MRRLRVATPVWFGGQGRPFQTAYPAVRRVQRADVAIVGGGVTGAAVAWMFARHGIRVVLLEASRVGCGSTAASTALLMQEPDKDLNELARLYGDRAARRIWRMSMAATRDFIGAIRSLHLDCRLEGRDSIYYALGESAGRRLRAEFADRKHAYLPGRWLGREALKRVTGIAGSGAVRTTGNAQVDPYLACTGLLRAAKRRGARIFEHSPVDRIETHASGAVLTVNGHAVHCGRILVATGYATPYFAPLAGHFRMFHTYVVATERLGAEVRQSVGLGDVMLWDTARPYHYARWTHDHRLLLGGGDRPRVPERRRTRALRNGADGVWRHFVRRYPALRDVRVDYAWEGLFASTRDGLPYIGAHEEYPRHLFALGYGGNGMTFGFLAARLLLEQHRGVRSKDHALFGFDR
jgi:glycine/D-amino acid oxidase-like deaminating enzyme